VSNDLLCGLKQREKFQELETPTVEEMMVLFAFGCERENGERENIHEIERERDCACVYGCVYK